MPLSDIKLPLSIKTTSADPIREFFDPCLSCAEQYNIAVGYFSSAWVRDAAHGLAKFALNQGSARWIVSPELSKEDFELLRNNNDGQLDNEKVSKLIERSFLALFDKLQKEPRESLGWLIAEKIIEFRVAIPTNELSGIMHAKMGYFRDSSNNEIGFSGSYNLTHGAQTNWEKIDIYCGWASEDAQRRVFGIKNDFEEMWGGKDPNLIIYEPTDKALDPFIRVAKFPSKLNSNKKELKSRYSIPEFFLNDGQMRPYQEDAIKNWFKNNGRGVFNMATGSGKTATALAAVTRLANHCEENKTKQAFIVVVPYKHLADQWIDEARLFGFSPLKCYDSSKKWLAGAQKIERSLATGSIKTAMLVVVNATFANDPFQQLLERLSGGICIIADEMHNLGAPRLLKALPESAQFRLGLSATPVRHGDEQGTKSLEEYFGDEAILFGLKDAIDSGFLCQYRYFPVPTPLTDDEMVEYREISMKIARLYQFKGDDDGPNEVVKNLLIKRTRLVAGAKNKTIELVKLLTQDKDSAYNLIYCGDSKDGDERNVEKVLRLVGKEVGMRVNKFTSDETPEERKSLLRLFGDGEIQTLVAIRCLDEGVDVPRTETAYILASSTNPRQFIQRRGRVLRKAQGKNTATIYDFIAVPDIDSIRQTNPKAFEVERRLVRRELDRIDEFANLAINGGESLSRLREIRKKLNLLDS